VALEQSVLADPYGENRATGAFIVIDRLSNITVGAGMVTALSETAQSDATQSDTAQFSEFELELNALVRKHFPHWQAIDLRRLKK
ncbi:MAG: sulfate adenylyltransferase subunit CysN, partial [Cellvibrionaceae bacterium]|nr:sulfate adenylyltransferase subunit CysN [Cellvibrionaceae bacterium]